MLDEKCSITEITETDIRFEQQFEKRQFARSYLRYPKRIEPWLSP